MEVTDEDWSGTLEFLLELSDDPYSYQEITDNSWSFKIRNRGKQNEYQQVSTYNAFLRKNFQYLPTNSDDEIVQQ
jgi:hypothetical protein